MTQKLDFYLSDGYKKVSGWLSEGGVKIIKKIADIQDELNLKGSIAEIGIHHGKLFILLHLLTKDTEKSVAWDLFENQNQNVDRSGKGDKEQFISNLKLYDCDLDRIKIIAENSLNLDPKKMLDTLETKARLFSIDGGHTAKITYHDLKNVSNVICEGGTIIIDDYFNSDWPGVSEGVVSYIKDYPNKLFPVVIGGNKFVFTNSQKYADRYIKLLLNSKLSAYKISKFAEKKVIIFNFKQTLLETIKERIKFKINSVLASDRLKII